ncbi:MAG: hypothetical protein EHM61_13870 [Acidobacteria bacterium]|nr:MAG: hypothetical protein EHM61_13870 [Acidobacteriota bacterium]
MLRKFVYPALVLLCVGALFSTAAYAQKWEIHPYAGGFFPRNADFGHFKDEGMYGVKANANLTPGFEIEGNFGYINHFEPRLTDPTSRGVLWEAAGNVHFPWGRLQPFVSGGVGGLTAVVDSDLLDPDQNGPGSVNLGGNRLDDGDTFFMVSYGGGLKAERLWGPLGLRVDVRGRTLPNIFSNSMTWLETTGGVTLSWGE